MTTMDVDDLARHASSSIRHSAGPVDGSLESVTDGIATLAPYDALAAAQEFELPLGVIVG
jgi:hypothetical protein